MDNFFQRPDTLEWATRSSTRSADRDAFKYEPNVFVYLEEMARALKEPGFDHDNTHNNATIKLFTELKVRGSTGKKNQIYHANPMRGGMPWNDWGQFDWNGMFCIGQLVAFVDFRNLPITNRLGFQPGIFVIMEPAKRSSVPAEQRRSDLFEPWVKKASSLAGMQQTHSECTMEPLSSLKMPAVVVPDLKNATDKRTYLRMVPRWQWPLMFEDWLEQPHIREWDD